MSDNQASPSHYKLFCDESCHLEHDNSGSSFLVTSFYLDDSGKHRDYERRYCSYKNKENRELDGCEWF